MSDAVTPKNFASGVARSWFTCASFALPEIIMDASLGIEENLIQDATLANLPSGLEEDTTHVGLNDGDNVNGINEANNEL